MLSSYTRDKRIAILNKLARAKVQWLRVDVPWFFVEPEASGERVPSMVRRANFIVDQARKRGFRIMMTLHGAPDWATEGEGNRGPPADLASFARFAGWAARHFRGRVQAWEVWNEPNHPDYWHGTPADYAALLKAAYPRLKGPNPKAMVVTGASVHNDYHWLREVYEAGAQGSFDVLGVNPYMAPADLPPETPDNGQIWTMAAVSHMRDLMVEFGDRKKPIWFAEFGWSSHPNDGTEENWQKGVSQQTQADYLVRTLRYVACEHPYVKKAFWYAAINRKPLPNPDKGDIQRENFGLLRWDLTRKPAFFTVRSFQHGPRKVQCST